MGQVLVAKACGARVGSASVARAIPAFVRARGGARSRPTERQPRGPRIASGRASGPGEGLQLHPNRKVENAFTVDCHPLRMYRDGEGDKRAIFVLSYRGPATVPLLSRLSKITLLIRTKTSNSTYPMRSRTSPNDAITPPRPKAWRNSRGAARIEVHSSQRGRTPLLNTSTPAASEETSEDVRNTVHGIGQQVQGVGDTVVVLRPEGRELPVEHAVDPDITDGRPDLRTPSVPSRMPL